MKMLPVERYQKLKTRVDSLRREADQAQGELNSLMRRLKEGFGCKTIKEAERLLKKKQNEADQLEKELEEKLAAFEEEWGELLEDEG